jgi:hypothetical protein
VVRDIKFQGTLPSRKILIDDTWMNKDEEEPQLDSEETTDISVNTTLAPNSTEETSHAENSIL